MKTKAGIVSLRVSMTEVMQLVCYCGGRNDFLRFIPSFSKSFPPPPRERGSWSLLEFLQKFWHFTISWNFQTFSFSQRFFKILLHFENVPWKLILWEIHSWISKPTLISKTIIGFGKLIPKKIGWTFEFWGFSSKKILGKYFRVSG